MAGQPTIPWLRRRATRRAVLRGVISTTGAIVLGGHVAGCGVVSDLRRAVTSPTGSPTPAVPRRGGTLTLAHSGQLGGLNPHRGANAGQDVATFVYDRVLNYDAGHHQYELIVAQSIENPDPLTYIIKINPNAKFQNTAPVPSRSVTALDIAMSWQAFADNPAATGKRFFTEYVDRYDTSNPAMLVVKMKKPNAWAMAGTGFGSYLAVVMPRELIDAGQLDKTAVGSGAYQLDEYDPTKVISFKRRADSWLVPDRPYLDKVVYRLIKERAELVAALRNKEVDAVVARDKWEAEQFGAYGPEMQIDRDISLPAILLMRADGEGLFKDERARQAVYSALDIAEIIELVERGQGTWSPPVPKLFANYCLPDDETMKCFPHDVKKARELLAAAGWDSKREVEFKYPYGGSAGRSELLAELVQKHLAVAGIVTKLVPQERTDTWQPQVTQQRDFQLTVTAVLPVGSSPDAWLQMFTTAGIGDGNLARWSDPEVDQLVDRQMAEFDAEKQKQDIMEAQRLILKKAAPIVNLYAPYVFTGRWGYYHPPQGTGQVGLAGHYAWTEKK